MNDGVVAPVVDPPATLPNDAAAAFQRLLEKNNNDGVKLASTLYDENHAHRQKIRELTAQLPKDGSKVLTAEEATEFQAFKELGIQPAEIKTSLAKIPELEKTAAELSQMETFREVAAVGGYKVPVLKKLMAEHPDAKFEIKTEKDKDQKETKVVYLRQGDKELPFTEFAQANFADFLPALKAEAEQLPIKTGNSADPPPALSSDTAPADIKAKAAQARSTHSQF